AVTFWETIAPLQERASPLRCAHMRAPQQPQLHFAQECFLDEGAARAGVDPLEHRLALLTDEREFAVLEAVKALSGWETRPSPRASAAGDVVTGRGVAINSGFGAHVATVCEVEVDRRSGRIWAKRF